MHLTTFKYKFLPLSTEQQVVKEVLVSLFAFKYAIMAIISFI